MKKQLFAMLCCLAVLTAATAQKNGPSTDTLRQLYERLLTSSDQADHDLLCSKMYALLQSGREKDWLTAMEYFARMKMQATVDSLMNEGKRRFPDGVLMRNAEQKKVYDIKDAKEKEAAFKAWQVRFPASKFPPDQEEVYDYGRYDVAYAYAKEDNVPMALKYTSMFKVKHWRGNGNYGVAQVLIKNGHLKEAVPLLKEAITDAQNYHTIWKNEDGASFAIVPYSSYCNTYAEVLYKQKQYDEALKYVKIAADSSRPRAAIYQNYMDILLAQGKKKEALDKALEAISKGVATAPMKEDAKKMYVEIKGSESGFEEYLAAAEKANTEKMLAELPKQMLNLPAPDFTLTDLDGNVVSLADYRGKTVVVDFWATWCGPCKASFPAMQMAVNKYKDSADVKFLFIHTWEHDDTATDMARHFIQDHNYTFRVLMDLKDKVSGSNKVVSSFNVTGIPTKFVIDKNGKIRFRVTGLNGGDEAAAKELSAMIELAEKS